MFKQGDRVSVVQGRYQGAFGTLTVVGETLSLLQRQDAVKGAIPVFNVNLAKLDEDRAKVNDGLLMNAALAALLIKLWEYATRRDDKTRYANYPSGEARRTLPNA